MKRYFTSAVLALFLATVFTAPALAQTTTAELQAIISSLMAQIAALQAQIQTISSQTPTTPTQPISTPSTPSCGFYRDLTVGARGEDISCLQNKLISEGYLEAGNNSGYFGMFTRAAVAKWQANHGVNATGYFGTISRGQLNTPTSSLPTVPIAQPVPTILVPPVPVPTTPYRNTIITVLTPNGGETWAKGSSKLINWSSMTCGYGTCGDSAPAYYDIRLQPQSTCSGDSVCPQQYRAPYTVTQNVYGTSFNWIVGSVKADEVPDGTYTIEVCQSGTSICDSSDSYFKITGSTLSPLVITTSSPLPNAKVGQYYLTSFHASGLTFPGIGHSTYISNGSIPSGLGFNVPYPDPNCTNWHTPERSCLGSWGGTPTMAGTYNFMLVLEEGVNYRETVKEFTLTVEPEVSQPVTVSLSRNSLSPSGKIPVGTQDAELLTVDVVEGQGAVLSNLSFKFTGTAFNHISNIRATDQNGGKIGVLSNFTNEHSWVWNGEMAIKERSIVNDTKRTISIRGDIASDVWSGVSDCASCSKWGYVEITRASVTGNNTVIGIPVSGHQFDLPFSQVFGSANDDQLAKILEAINRIRESINSLR